MQFLLFDWRRTLRHDHSTSRNIANLLKKGRIMVLFVIISVILFLIFLAKVLPQSPFSENTGLYFYSAFIQANAAIFSIVGVFFVFRFQSIKSSISENRNLFNNAGEEVKKFAQSFEELSNEGKEIEVKRMQGNYALTNAYRKWLQLEKELTSVKSKIIKPLIFIVILLMIESLFLLLSNGIHKLGFADESLLFGFILIFQSYVLSTVIYSIRKVIDNKES